LLNTTSGETTLQTKLANNNKTKRFCRSAPPHCAASFVVIVYCLDRNNYLTWSGSGQVAKMVVVKGKAIPVQALMDPGG
jgi:hypothetical protein